jgi:hypothetical protein
MVRMMLYIFFLFSVSFGCAQGGLISAPSLDASWQVFGSDAGSGPDSGPPGSVGSIVDSHDAASDMGVPAWSPPYFATCQQYLDYTPGAADGEVTLYVRHDPGLAWTAYCADMTGAPREFLPLARTGPEVNFAQYTKPMNAEGTHVRTQYTKLRVNPASLHVEIADQTFASSTGELRVQRDSGVLEVTAMPYGVAAGCGAGNREIFEGLAFIDLRDTPFKVVDTFVAGGFRADGQAIFSNGNQTVEISGDQYCGWMAPAETLYDPVNQRGGKLHLAHIHE